MIGLFLVFPMWVLAEWIHERLQQRKGSNAARESRPKTETPYGTVDKHREILLASVMKKEDADALLKSYRDANAP